MSVSSRIRVGLAVLGSAALALGLPATTLAAEVRTGDTVVIPVGETISDDVYAFGSNVTIDGTVNGDVIAAGSIITITGRVTGDVMAAGNMVTVSGPVGGSVRAAGNILALSGPVAGDALTAGSTVNITGPAGVGRDMLASAANIDVRAPIGRDVKASGGTLTVASTVGGALKAEVSNLVLTNGAAVQGPISYVSDKELTVAPDAKIGNSVQRAAPPTRTVNPWVFGGIDVLSAFRGFIGLAAFGLLFALMFPRASMTTAATVQQHWLASLGLGFGLFVAVPVLALLVLVFGIMIGGWWISLILLGFYAVLTVMGYLATSLWAGDMVMRSAKWQWHPAWRLVFGLAIVGLLTLVPFIGPLVGFIAVLIGLGGLTFAAWSAYHTPATVTTTPAVSVTAAPMPMPA